MRALITGIEGFVGGHLAKHLVDTQHDLELHGTVWQPLAEQMPLAQCHQMDLRDYDAVHALIKQVQPEAIYHLAAQAFVPRSFEAPWETLENNIRGQLNLTLACLDLGIRPRMLIISSAVIYGSARPDEMPLREEAPLRPNNPYSVSKVTQDMLGLQYFLSHDFPIMRARAFNHLGPGQNTHFVAPAFATQIARIEARRQEPVIRVGNLSVKRDFTDVRDIVRGYRLIMEHGTPGAVYNLASGNAQSIQTLLDTLLAFTTVPIEVVIDDALLRPSEIPVLQGDATRLYNATGWQPEITFEQTLHDVLDDCRARIRNEGK